MLKKSSIVVLVLVFAFTVFVPTTSHAGLVNKIVNAIRGVRHKVVDHEERITALEELPPGEPGPPGPVAGSDEQFIYNDNGSAAGAEVYYSEGKVGIGMSAPLDIVHVKGSNAAVRVERTSGSAPSVHLMNKGGRAASIFVGQAGTPSEDELHFTNRNEGKDFVFTNLESGETYVSEKMRITSEGNVGIGTPYPESSLQVNGYIQLALTSDAPPSADCDEAYELGRMKVDNEAGLLYICVDTGWVAK